MDVHAFDVSTPRPLAVREGGKREEEGVGGRRGGKRERERGKEEEKGREARVF